MCLSKLMLSVNDKGFIWRYQTCFLEFIIMKTMIAFNFIRTYKKSLINTNLMRYVVQVNGDFNGLNSIFRTR